MAGLCVGGSEPPGPLKATHKKHSEADNAEFVMITSTLTPQCASVSAVPCFRDHSLCLSLVQCLRKKGNNTRREGFDPVLWIELRRSSVIRTLGIRRTKDPGSIPGSGANFSPLYQYQSGLSEHLKGAAYLQGLQNTCHCSRRMYPMRRDMCFLHDGAPPPTSPLGTRKKPVWQIQEEASWLCGQAEGVVVNSSSNLERVLVFVCVRRGK
ncbi:hypothetical protein ANN_06318 [Periplaneta americana]|uniref:Uncharacterized protein n=1 Tax=Periplaneta americana TaxID=6978 RepID=A0ABQ8TD82_PERAM|nr:hypothetical protein ANN_06318 [Periplaneta americana]